MHASRLLALVTLLAALAPAAPQKPLTAQDHAAIHREMDELFSQVELRQRGIDRKLYDVSAGGKVAVPVSGSGMGNLLVKARDDGRDVQRDNQRILELAANHTHQGGT